MLYRIINNIFYQDKKRSYVVFICLYINDRWKRLCSEIFCSRIRTFLQDQRHFNTLNDMLWWYCFNKDNNILTESEIFQENKTYFNRNTINILCSKWIRNISTGLTIFQKQQKRFKRNRNILTKSNSFEPDKKYF